MGIIDPRIFRAYDIRGKALTQVSEDACREIAYTFGQELAERYHLRSPRIAVGRDARTHSPLLEKAVIDGLHRANCDVLAIGQNPSPTNYFTVCTLELDGSIQITASHNHKDDNGLKLQMRNAGAFCGNDIQELEKKIAPLPYPLPRGEGKIETFDAISPYITHLTTMFKDVGKGVHVVIDGGNGVAGPVYSQILKNISCTVTELFIDPDGTFPNHSADPSKWDTLKDLQKTIKESEADIGLAFDGDGDRLGIVDETGIIRTADDILLLLAKDHLTRHPRAPIIFTVSSSGILESEIKKWGGKPVMEKVGHSFVEHAMEVQGALLGGEQSGHFFCFENYFHFDDAMVAGLHLLKILSQSSSPLSKLFDEFPHVYQSLEVRPHCPDDSKTRIVRSIVTYFSKIYPVNTLDGARINFGEEAWASIRQSNTSPCLSVCMEARNPEKLKEVEKIVWEHLKTYPEIEK